MSAPVGKVDQPTEDPVRLQSIKVSCARGSVLTLGVASFPMRLLAEVSEFSDFFRQGVGKISARPGASKSRTA